MERSFRNGTVLDKVLIYLSDNQEVAITIGTPDWYNWLEQAQSFSFKNEEGTFTAHKARASNQRGGWYWYAYRRRHGKLFRSYLGASSNLTLERLHTIARQLAQRSEVQNYRVSEQDTYVSPTSQTEETGQTLLLASRFRVPCLPIHYIARPRLIEELNRGTLARLTVVSAPAGAGKTMLLAEWAQTTSMPVAWLSLETTDDPFRFLAYLSASLREPGIGIAEKDIRPLHLQQGQSWEETLTRFVNDLTSLLTRDTVLILDDYQLIASEPVHEALRFLLDYAPLQLHFFIGTRADPPLPLARLRAHGQLKELHTEALHFSSSELQAFLRGMDVNLSAETQQMIERQTQGWIVGVHLLSLALRSNFNCVSTLPRAQPGAHCYFLEYVSEEILARQPASVRTFLLHTSVLERLTDSLCAAVTALPDGPSLEFLHRSNLLLQSIDGTGTWYRYHPLFAEALRAQLQKKQPELIPELYLRASRWYEQHNLGEQACEYAFLAADLPQAARLLSEQIPQMVVEGKITRLGNWLRQLSPALIATYPSLCFASLWLQCQTEDMELLITRLEHHIEAHALDAESPWLDLQEELTLFQAWAALFQDDVTRTITLISETLQAHFKPESALRRLIATHQRLALSTAYRANGDLEAAECVLQEVSSLDTAGVDHLLHLFSAMNLVVLYEDQGQLRKLGQLYREMFRALDQRNDVSPLSLALTQVRYAALMYEWNRFPEAEAAIQRFRELISMLDFAVPHCSLLCLWIEARIALAKGNAERARQVLQSEEFTHGHSHTFEESALIHNSIPAQIIPARLALVCDQVEQVEQWEMERGIRFDDPLKTPLSGCVFVDYILLVRILLARGRNQQSSTLLNQALTLLDQLRSAISGLGCNGWFIEVQMLTALVLQAQGKTKRALKTLGPVLAQAEPEGYVRLFADEGQPMAHLLAQISAHTSASLSYIQRLQKAIPFFPDMLIEALPRQPLLEPLSSREQEVLRLLSAGFSNQQIADHLIISLHTVKLHVKHILAKLTVTNRTQAVTRARELKVL